MKYVDERKYDVMDRISCAVFFSIVWALIGTGNTPFLGEVLFNLWLVFCAEFSFEYHEGKLKIRAAGKRWILDGWLRILVWPLAKAITLIGGKNCPLLVYAMTAAFIYAMFAGVQILDTLVHIGLLWYLYYMRKAEK